MARTLRVGVSASAPFVIQDPVGDGLSGISIDVWRRVAEANDLPYDLIRQSSIDAGIAAVEAKKIDVLIGPVSVTASRLARPEVDFTQPYYIDRAGVLLPLQRANLSSRLQVLFGWAVVSSILVWSAFCWWLARSSGWLNIATTRSNFLPSPCQASPTACGLPW